MPSSVVGDIIKGALVRYYDYADTYDVAEVIYFLAWSADAFSSIQVYLNRKYPGRKLSELAATDILVKLGRSHEIPSSSF